MKARLYLGDKLLGECAVVAVPAMVQERGKPRRDELPGLGDTVTVAFIADGAARDEAHPLFLTGRLERA